MNTEPSSHTVILAGYRKAAPYIASVGRAKQVRIMQIQGDCRNDIAPCLAEFLEKGAKNNQNVRQQRDRA